MRQHLYTKNRQERSRRSAAAWYRPALIAILMIFAAASFGVGLLYGQPERVWDSALRVWTYRSRPASTVIAWLGCVVGIITITAVLRLGRRR